MVAYLPNDALRQRQWSLAGIFQIDPKDHRKRTAACLIAAVSDLKPEEAIRIVRRARPGTVETRSQEEYVSKFREFLSARPTQMVKTDPRSPTNFHEESLAWRHFVDRLLASKLGHHPHCRRLQQ